MHQSCRHLLIWFTLWPYCDEIRRDTIIQESETLAQTQGNKANLLFQGHGIRDQDWSRYHYTTTDAEVHPDIYEATGVSEGAVLWSQRDRQTRNWTFAQALFVALAKLPFPSYKKGHKGDISRVTLSGWIKMTIIIAYKLARENDLNLSKSEGSSSYSNCHFDSLIQFTFYKLSIRGRYMGKP